MTLTAEDLIIREQRRADLDKIMTENGLKIKEVAELAKFNETTVSQFRTGKVSITDKTWAMLEPALNQLVLIKHPTKDLAQFKFTDFMFQILSAKGNYSFNKAFVGQDPELFREALKSHGFACTLTNDQDGDWIAWIKPPVSDTIIESKTILPVKAAKVVPVSIDKEELKVLLSPETLDGPTAAEQWACLNRIIARNEASLANADIIGSVVVERIQCEQPVLRSIVDGLKRPVNNTDLLEAHRSHLASIKSIAQELLSEVDRFINPGGEAV